MLKSRSYGNVLRGEVALLLLMVLTLVSSCKTCNCPAYTCHPQPPAKAGAYAGMGETGGYTIII
jgi:hypothetical protein